MSDDTIVSETMYFKVVRLDALGHEYVFLMDCQRVWSKDLALKALRRQHSTHPGFVRLIEMTAEQYARRFDDE